MFNSLSGTLSGVGPSQIYLQTPFIEWTLWVPAKEIAALQIGDELRLWVFLSHTQDNMSLYGFFSPSQRDLFLNLLKVNGIGPKQALKILGAEDSALLCHAIEAADTTRLAKVPGVGAKTAAKIILALKGKLTAVSQIPSEAPAPYADLIAALTEMGFSRKEAQRVVNEKAAALAADFSGQALEDEIFKAAIVDLSR